MRSKLMTAFITVLIILIGIAHAKAESVKWRIDLTVDSIDGEIPGIAIGDQFVARFEVEPSLLAMPDGIQGGRFINFDLTIGQVNWNESQPHSSPQFLLSSGGIDAMSGVYTVTLPAHPDLSLFLPESSATWEVKDENDPTGKPIFGGNFGGIYTIAPILDCRGAFNFDRDRDVDGSDLAHYLASIDDLAGFASVFGSQDYCPRPEPECTNTRNGWVVLKNDTENMTQLYVASKANAWGEIVPDTFLPADFPALVDGAVVVYSLNEFAPDTYYLGDLPTGHYSILVSRSVVRDLGDGTTQEYIRIVYLNSDVTVISCEQLAKLDLDVSSYNAYDMELPGDVEEIAYEEFKMLLDNGRLSLVNSRINDEQRAESDRRYINNVAYVQDRLGVLDPEFLAFLEQPILDDDVNDPSGDNWHLTITDSTGETSIVTTLGKKFLYATVAESLKAKGTIDNERTAYLTLYNALQAAVPADDWTTITTELELMRPEVAQAVTDVDLIEIEKQKIFINWDSIKTLIVPDPEAEPSDKPACLKERGDFLNSLLSLGEGTTDQYGGHRAHASNGVFENYFYPLKWYATCVKNQKRRGSCVAFGITGAVETSWAVQTNEWVNLSEQWLYYKAKNEWWPSIFGDGLNTLSTAQTMSFIIYQFLYPWESQWMYNASVNRLEIDLPNFQMYQSSCTDYYSYPESSAIPCSDTNHQGRHICSQPYCGYYAEKNGDSRLTNQSSAEIWGFGGSKEASIFLAKSLLTVKIPLVLSYSVTPSYKTARDSGFIYYTTPFEPSYGGHTTLVTGYIDNENITVAMDVPPNEKSTNGGGYFIVKNSWGGKWKDAGYIYIPYNWVKAYTTSLITVKAEKKN